MRRLFVWIALSALAVEIQSAFAAPVSADPHPIVPGFERFYTGPVADPLAGGRLLLGELNCTSCHAADKPTAAQIAKKTAPVLNDVGSRIKPDHLRKFLANPHQVKPGTTMPDLFAGVPSDSAKAQVDAIVHFLTATSGVAESLVDPAAVKRGDKLFHEVGCVACHAPRRPDAQPLTTAVPLGDVAEKYTVPSLISFLQDPHKSRPSGRMPSLKLSNDEARDVAHYLLQGSHVAPNVHFEVYQGNFQKLPDFDSLKPVQTGVSAGFDLGVVKPKSNFAVRYTGYLQSWRKDSEHTFYLHSDDGSRLWVDGLVVVDNDGTHPPQTKTGKMRLTTGAHPITVEFFQGGGGVELNIEIEPKGAERRSLASVVTLKKDTEGLPKPPDAAPPDLDPDKLAKGRELFATLGCASCHQFKLGNTAIASKLEAKPLKQLTTGGCLASTPEKGLPIYRLSQLQQKALAAALAAPAALAAAPASSKEAIARTMLTFNCYACHVRDGVGGVEDQRNDYFATTMKEMGDEGRIPPALNGAGDKLTLKWIKHIFDTGGEDRPYMLTRMPKFNSQNLGQLAEQLEAADLKPEGKLPEIEEPQYRIDSAGRFLVGAKALSCIKCHDFAQHPSTGIRATNLTRMTLRLREDWFHRYLLDPQAYRPGTRMPAAWPQGQTFVRDVLSGDAHKQIRGIWMYLTAGNKAAVPAGLIAGPIDLVPEKEPIVYRNFIDGAGPRAIGVGYPEKVNVAFDADNLRLALVWHGAFIDASRHWNGRGVGFQPPSGDHILPLAAGVPLAMLDDHAKAPWPTEPAKSQGYQFRGYRLDSQRRPMFQYQYGSIQVVDDIQPVKGEKEASLRRTLTLDSPAAMNNLWFRAGTAKSIEPSGEGWYLIDKIWKLRVDCAGAAAAPVVRQVGNQAELILPVRPHGNKAVIVQEFVW